MAATTFMTDRLLRAAQALLFHGEVIEVRYVGFGTWRECLLLGPGSAPHTVKLGIWCAAGEIREGRTKEGKAMPIRFVDCLIPPATLARLEVVARAQEPAPESEMVRALLFIASARQRTRDGRFAGFPHCVEKAGTI